MKKSLSVVISLVFFVCLSPKSAHSCSSAFFNDENTKIVGRNMDWPKGDGVIEINARNIKKQARFIENGSKPAEWVSNYGSVTFNLVEKVQGLGKMDASSCGLNEKGLWIGALWILTPPEVKYPEENGKPTINTFEFEQYVLDNFKTVDEVIKNLSKIRISAFKKGDLDVTLHWYIADESGDSAIVEFPNGKLSVHRNPNPLVMTNSFYETSQDYLKGYEGFGGNKPIPDPKKLSTDSLDRYMMASYQLTKAEKAKDMSVKSLFKVMKSVNQSKIKNAKTSHSETQWTIAYNLKTKQITWFTKANPRVRTMDLSKVDFSPVRNLKKM